MSLCQVLVILTVFYVFIFLLLYIYLLRFLWWLSAKKTRLAMQEIESRSLGWKDPLEKEMATHSEILAWEISWTEGAWQGLQKSQTRLSD